jgi:hypothetical protein
MTTLSLRPLSPPAFGDRTTREKWEQECKQAKRAGRERHARFIVAPRMHLSTARGVLPPGTEVFETSDFDGFGYRYPSDDGTPELVPLRADQAIQRAVDYGVVLDCFERASAVG